MNRLSLLWSNPLDKQQDAVQLFLLFGMVLMFAMLWRIIMSHITD